MTIAVLLIFALLLSACSRTRPLYSPTALGSERLYQVLVNKKVRVRLYDNAMIEGVLVNAKKDSITIRPPNNESSMQIAKRDVKHIEGFATERSILVGGVVVLVLLIMYFSIQGLAAGIASAGH